MKCTKEGSYDELLNYMKEVDSAEELLALREHKIIQHIVDNTKEEKILKSYLERIKTYEKSADGRSWMAAGQQRAFLFWQFA